MVSLAEPLSIGSLSSAERTVLPVRKTSIQMIGIPFPTGTLLVIRIKPRTNSTSSPTSKKHPGSLVLKRPPASSERDAGPIASRLTKASCVLHLSPEAAGSHQGMRRRKTHAIQYHQRHGGARTTVSLVHSRICESISIAGTSKEPSRKAEQRDLLLDTNRHLADVLAKASPTGEYYLVFAAHRTTLL
jgi:hypothetical protein